MHKAVNALDYDTIFSKHYKLAKVVELETWNRDIYNFFVNGFH